jgi:hypothetical protein
MRLVRLIREIWTSVPIDGQGTKRTRWLLTLLSFVILSFLMIGAFFASLRQPEEKLPLALELVNLTLHLSYVFGGTISAYYAVESFFPSSDRPMRWMRKGMDEEPPVKPDEEDSQVD